ncbi:hypothetical protein ASPVEDRAFT_34888 [Aspergillus versicolor CBS 583.65]|uniref:Uncharacterized protein n=1 Tax=Aspergillus versicolor CBS 583.65 TaxID=1036611 RepID=A0A1L9Q4R3_ASPVE|nr:uncharacterized protein ASPVEDRAFT_34888 [Aspergillus versicolor CBS 583.65]OJJ08757.1 hypothetical protein ASPVEDRAFT_34888 [Aspergillus versicolor CBS 583.65]
MKLSLGTLALALGDLNMVSAFTETYSCYSNKCTGACTPTDGGRDGIPTEVQWGEGQAWCYLKKTGRRPGSEDAPITCLDGVGCSVPASGAGYLAEIACLCKAEYISSGGMIGQ